MTGSKKYNIIYADPPWRYEQRTVQGGAEQHYPTMTLDDICALPVAELADKDCALFLWTTFPKLKEAFRVIESWGFVYRTLAFLWLKQNRKADTWFYGMGFWTRSNAEVCLLAVKGHPKRQCAGIHQRRHLQAIYQIIGHHSLQFYNFQFIIYLTIFTILQFLAGMCITVFLPPKAQPSRPESLSLSK